MFAYARRIQLGFLLALLGLVSSCGYTPLLLLTLSLSLDQQLALSNPMSQPTQLYVTVKDAVSGKSGSTTYYRDSSNNWSPTNSAMPAMKPAVVDGVVLAVDLPLDASGSVSVRVDVIGIGMGMAPTTLTSLCGTGIKDSRSVYNATATKQMPGMMCP